MKMAEGIVLVLKRRIRNEECRDHMHDLLAMYLKWANKNGYKIDVLDQDEAGQEHFIVQMQGEELYHKLKHETGTHRFVRKSPYDAKDRIHTTFVECLIMQAPKEGDVILSLDEVKFEVMRPNYVGGQVAGMPKMPIKATHIPTGENATAFGERSQLKTRDDALFLLKCKLIYGDFMKQNEMNVIRSYRYHPFTQVFDLRSGKRTEDIEDIISGNFEYLLTT